jgi:acetyl-CoA carboxylase carboxyl transferase alpha subunit
MLLDSGTFVETASDLESVDPLLFQDTMPYPERLAQARQKTGLSEAVATGSGRINGREAVLAVLDFDFLGGTMGAVVGEKIALAMELALKRRLPFISVAASGGARMQEGMLSLMQMAKTTAAALRLRQHGVPFISVLTNPTTGGVYAGFASQGSIILAEPGALIGFAGPRVIEGVTGKPAPRDAQTAEFLLEHGMIDAVVERSRLRNVLATVLQLLDNPFKLGQRSDELYRPTPRPPDSAWEAVQLARHRARPTSWDYIQRIMPQFVELHGDRLHGEDPALIGGIGDMGGIIVVALAQERGRGDEQQRRHEGRMRPEGYRKAARLMRLAAELHLPLVTFIDTPGAALDFEAEANGLAPSISACLATMSILPVPIVAAVIGEGGSGGALALGVADQVLMQENAIYSVIAPEGAAAILYHDVERAQQVAEALRLTAADCLKLGVVDTVVPEPTGGAHQDPDYAALLLRNFIVDALVGLRGRSGAHLVEDRYRKFRHLGQQEVRFRETVAREIEELQQAFGQRLGHINEIIPRLPRTSRGRPLPEPEPEETAS